jgi:prolyl-tRNA synthetase
MTKKLPSKEKNFSEWYTEVIRRADMADYAPVKGCIVFKPYSYEIWERIQDYFNQKIKETGHKNAYFPLFIPEKLLKKEAEHFKGFIPEVAWVTRGGSSDLEEPLAVRPTSETIMYYMYSDWVRSHRDLPLLLNQWCNVVRWETKATKPFLRTKEFLWQEGHTVHATKEGADKEVLMILSFYQDLIENLLAIPVLVGTKTKAEKFAGALYTTTLEAIMTDGKALQMGTSHNLGQHFSKAFGIKFEDEDGKKKYAWQTSWGISTRLIGALIMAHGDDKGLRLPPRVAPIQAVIVPIFYDESKREVLKAVRELEKALTNLGVRVYADIREQYTPGWKFNEWELCGVPVRIEVGPKDVERRQFVAVRRDSGEKGTMKDVKAIPKLLEEIQSTLFKQAKKFLDEHITNVKTYEEFKKVLEKKKGFLRTNWCGDTECELGIKDETGATTRCIPFDEKPEKGVKCFKCGKQAKHIMYFARAY